jgi:Na+/melibiose symporter-like transporter
MASTGDGLILGAVPLLAVVVDPHPLAVSAVAAADTLPWLLVALPAGAFADRFDRGPLMALVNVLRAGAVLVAALLLLSGQMTLVLLILVVLVNAAARAIYYSSYQAVVPDMVESESLERANGVLTGTESAAEQLAGPVVGTALFTASHAIPFVADAFVLILSAFPFLRVHSKAPRSTESQTSIWDGLKRLFVDRRLRLLVVILSCLSGLQGMEFGILVLIATKVWGVGAGAYGVFLAAGAFGNILGSFAANGLVRRFGSGLVIIGGAIASGVGYLIMASTDTWRVAGPAFVLVGFAVTVVTVDAISLRQRLTPPELMGRVGSAWRGIVWGAAPVGAIAAGALATIGGLRLPLVLAGLLQCAVAVLLGPFLVRSLRQGANASVEAAGPPIQLEARHARHD